MEFCNELKECLLHLSSKSYKEFSAFLTAIYKVVDNFDSHVCAPFICINTQIQKVGCGVPVRATAVGRDAERKAERNAVLAGDPKGLDYYVILL